jgi:GrpB-like predicted nucleotidyltransferase (UPF0157 family)
MNWGVVLGIGIITLPFFMMPAVFAFKNGKRFAWAILVLNIMVTAALPFGAGALLAALFGFESAFIGAMPIAVTLACWLVLLRSSLRRDQPGPVDVDEPVTLVSYDAAWPEAFTRERRRITEAVALADDRIEHIGSTAVPGLSAKPVVDLMIGVDRLPPSHDLLARLEILGYQNLGEAGVPGRVYLRIRGGEREFNVHVMERGGGLWKDNIALRELLRADPVARERYERGKVGAMQAGGGRLKGYSDAKHPLITELLATARAR